MKQLPLILVFVLTFPLLNFRNDKDLAGEKYLNFIAAIENNSTYSYFTVIKAKNLNTGQVKEICISGKFLIGALAIELKKDYNDNGEVLAFAKSKRDLFFEFRNRKALENISFFDYDPAQLPKIKTKYNFDKVVEIIKTTKKFSIRLSDIEMKLFAHVLFNRGYMTGESDCFGGTLDYVDRTEKEM